LFAIRFFGNIFVKKSNQTSDENNGREVRERNDRSAERSGNRSQRLSRQYSDRPPPYVIAIDDKYSKQLPPSYDEVRQKY